MWQIGRLFMEKLVRTRARNIMRNLNKESTLKVYTLPQREASVVDIRVVDVDISILLVSLVLLFGDEFTRLLNDIAFDSVFVEHNKLVGVGIYLVVLGQHEEERRNNASYGG